MQRFSDDYNKLQEQFKDIAQQKTGLQEDMNRASHSLQQREARCQQLAMQVRHLHFKDFKKQLVLLCDDLYDIVMPYYVMNYDVIALPFYVLKKI